MKRISLNTLTLFTLLTLVGCDSRQAKAANFTVSASESCVKTSTGILGGQLCKATLRYSSVCYLYGVNQYYKGGAAWAVNIPCSVYDKETNKAKVLQDAKRTIKNMEENDEKEGI